jgi:hypothetical protein
LLFATLLQSATDFAIQRTSLSVDGFVLEPDPKLNGQAQWSRGGLFGGGHHVDEI